MQITAIGLDLVKHWFQVHEWHDGQDPRDHGAPGQMAPGKPGQSVDGDGAPASAS
jgi:hypothetical protein